MGLAATPSGYSEQPAPSGYCGQPAPSNFGFVPNFTADEHFTRLAVNETSPKDDFLHVGQVTTVTTRKLPSGAEEEADSMMCLRLIMKELVLDVPIGWEAYAAWRRNPGIGSLESAIVPVTSGILRCGIKDFLTRLSLLSDSARISGIGNTTPAFELSDWARNMLAMHYDKTRTTSTGPR
jgi:hypothetical protein